MYLISYSVGTERILMVSHMFKGLNLLELSNSNNFEIYFFRRVSLGCATFSYSCWLCDVKSGIFNPKAVPRGLYEINSCNSVVIFERICCNCLFNCPSPLVCYKLGEDSDALVHRCVSCA